MQEAGGIHASPLAGARVLVPRAVNQAGGMKSHLESLGATVLCVPTIAFEAPADPTPMREAYESLRTGGFAWTVFTSTNAVDAFFTTAGSPQQGCEALRQTKVASVGTKTTKELEKHGVTVELMPAETAQNAAGLVDVFPHFDSQRDGTDAVFLPRADIATAVLPQGLTAAGWNPIDVTAYHTVPAPTPARDMCTQITSGGVDAICFTSGSTVRNLLTMVGAPAPSTVIACIGPMAAEQASASGLHVHVMPERASARDLVDALAAYFLRRRTT